MPPFSAPLNLPLFLRVSASKIIYKSVLEFQSRVLELVALESPEFYHSSQVTYWFTGFLLISYSKHEAYQIISYNENDVWLGALLDGAC